MAHDGLKIKKYVDALSYQRNNYYVGILTIDQHLGDVVKLIIFTLSMTWLENTDSELQLEPNEVGNKTKLQHCGSLKEYILNSELYLLK